MVTWSLTGRADLKSIYSYIANDSIVNAQKVLQAIMQKTEILVEQPYIGKKHARSNNDSIRTISAYSWHIIYHIQDDHNIHVLTVVHHRRDPLSITIPKQ